MRQWPWRQAALAAGTLALSGVLLECAIAGAAPELRTAVLGDAAIPRGSLALVEGHLASLYSPDPRLGWIPTPNHRGHKWGLDIETKEHGIRSNGAPSQLPVRALAIGDSNTFGDEVADADTWPAQLERMLGVGVANAGVSSYGLDQMVLRAEELVPLLEPRVLVVGLISDSLVRAGQAVRHGSPKPYFVVGPTGRLELRHSPVPPARPVPLWRQQLGRSVFVSFVMGRLAASFWWRGTMRDFEPSGSDLDEVGRQLIARLVSLARRHELGLCVLLVDATEEETADEDLRKLDSWLALYRGAKVRSVHTAPSFASAAAEHSDGLAGLNNPPPLIHFNAAGQRVVAEVARPEVAALLR
jgi:hypothetical protein